MKKHKKKIRVCFFSPSSYVYFNKNVKSVHGGAELQMYLIACALKKYPKLELLFFVGDFGQSKEEKLEGIMLIKAFLMPTAEKVLTKILKALKFFYLLAKYRPNIVITTSASTMVALTGLFKHLFRIKHIHRTASIVDVNLSWVEQNGFLGRIYKTSIKKADTVIVQNKMQQELLLKNHNKTSIIIKNILLNSKNQNRKKASVLWVGRLNKLKRPELYLDLASKIPEHKFIMICPFNEQDIEKWLSLQKRADSLMNFKLIENVEFNKIQLYFDEANILVNTSSVEGFPNTFLQAASAKTPILSLNVNPDNFIGQYNCGVFCNNNFNYMVAQCRELLSNDHLRFKLGNNAFQYLKDNHDYDLLVEQWHKTIISV